MAFRILSSGDDGVCSVTQLLVSCRFRVGTGHGNHFQQSYTHAYGVITEPIFARLGVHASSRNFGFGGLGTIQTGMAGAALMGPDVDVLMWDSGMTEKGPSVGVLAVQYALAGDRIPVFLGDKGHSEKLHDSAGMDTGRETGGASLKKRPTTVAEFEALPWAAQCMSKAIPELKTICGKGNLYRGTCWINRTDFEWNGMDMSYTPTAKQGAAPGGRASWHPGDRVHQIKGRALAGIVLNGIRDALLEWKESANLVLKDEDWHGTNLFVQNTGNVWSLVSN